jgi:hypothetical protein
MNLVADGLVFDNTGLRCRYLGKTSREKPQYLKEIAGRWRRIEDVQREAAQPAAPVESDVNVVTASSGPNCQTSPHEVRKDGDDEDGVALVDALSGDCSPPCEPTLSTPVNASGPNGSMKAELLPSAKAATSETEGPKTETTALGAMGRKRKQGRSGGRKKQKRPAETSNARQKRHERMRVVLESLSECPTQRHAAREAGIHPKTLAYWLKCSEAGDDGYDIEWQGWMSRFHEHVESAIDEPVGKVEVKAFELAKGVLYNEDDPHVYIRPPDGKMIRFLLDWWDKYGNHPKIDIPQKGGVVLIVPTGGLPRQDETGAPPPEPPARERRRKKVRKWKSLSRMLRKTKV